MHEPIGRRGGHAALAVGPSLARRRSTSPTMSPAPSHSAAQWRPVPRRGAPGSSARRATVRPMIAGPRRRAGPQPSRPNGPSRGRWPPCQGGRSLLVVATRPPSGRGSAVGGEGQHRSRHGDALEPRPGPNQQRSRRPPQPRRIGRGAGLGGLFDLPTPRRLLRQPLPVRLLGPVVRGQVRIHRTVPPLRGPFARRSSLVRSRLACLGVAPACAPAGGAASYDRRISGTRSHTTDLRRSHEPT
jgi:hypothetical protein